MYKRGDVFYCDLSPVIGSEQGGLRPCVIIQNNIGNKHAPTLIIAPMTSALKKPLPTHVVVNEGEANLQKGGTILCEQIRTIDKRRARSYVGTLSDEVMLAVNVAVKVSLALD